jgi:beta-lactamase superfamily II metal-dependent hydrolase
MKRKLSLLLLLIILLAGGAAKHSAGNLSVAPGRMQAYVIDVGRGQSVLVISPAGKAALIDAGPPEAGQRVVNELRRRGVQNLEYVFATQAGADYIGGLRRVAGSSDIVIRNFIDSAQPWKTDAYQQVLAAVQSANVPVIQARRGLFFDLGGGARIDVVNPAGSGTWIDVPGVSKENANAVMVRVIYREFIMLVMGGAGAATAMNAVEARQNIWAPFLVVGNQGAQGSVSEKMLSIVQPKFAIIQTTANNAPATETIELLKAAKAEIYRMGEVGSIAITSDGKQHEITTERKSAP